MTFRSKLLYSYSGIRPIERSLNVLFMRPSLFPDHFQLLRLRFTSAVMAYTLPWHTFKLQPERKRETTDCVLNGSYGRLIMNNRKFQTIITKSGRGRLRKVSSIVIWLENFSYFRKVVAYERRSQTEVRLYSKKIWFRFLIWVWIPNAKSPWIPDSWIRWRCGLWVHCLQKADPWKTNHVPSAQPKKGILQTVSYEGVSIPVCSL